MKKHSAYNANRDSELAERLHQFEVVCRTLLKTATTTTGGKKRKNSMTEIGKQFGLSKQHIHYCVGRAKNFWDDVRELERARNAAKFKRNPTKFKIAA
jgi:hypothetical protein